MTAKLILIVFIIRVLEFFVTIFTIVSILIVVRTSCWVVLLMLLLLLISVIAVACMCELMLLVRTTSMLHRVMVLLSEWRHMILLVFQLLLNCVRIVTIRLMHWVMLLVHWVRLLMHWVRWLVH